MVVDEREVDVTGLQEHRRLVRLGLAQAQLHIRVASVEGGDGPGHDRRSGALEAHEPQAPAAQAGDGREVLLRRVEPRKDRVRMRDEHGAGLGEADATREALHELGSGLALERSDVLAHGGLREVERLRRSRERALGRHLSQHLHPADVEHQHSLSSCQAGFIGTNGSHLVSW